MATEKYWLMKSEPNVYSIDDLARQGKGPWDGVRNFRARNFMRYEMSLGDLMLFYHSSVDPPGVAGVGAIASPAYPDPTQFDTKSQYFDAKSTRERPRWYLVDVQFVEKVPCFVPLSAMRQEPALSGMMLLRKGMRLSIQPVERPHFAHVLSMAKAITTLPPLST